MAEWKKRIWLKTLIILLFAGSMALMLLSGGALFYMGTMGYYDQGATKETMMKRELYNMGCNEAWDAYYNWENYGLLALNSTYYAKQNYNMAICLQDEEGTVIFENYTAEQDAYVFEIPIAGYMEYDEETQKEIYRDYTVKCAIDLNFPAEDSFKRTAETVDLLWNLRQINIVVCILSAVGVCFFFICAIRGAGHKAEKDEICLRWEDKLPLDGYWLILAASFTFLLSMSIDMVNNLLRQDWIVRMILAVIAATLACMLVLEAILTLAIRIKAGGWWKNSLIYIILHRIWRGICRIGSCFAYIWRHISMIWRLVLFLVVWFIIELIIVAAGGPETAVWLGLGERIVFMPLLLLLVIGLHRVMEGGEKMAEGDLDYKIDLRMLHGSVKQHAQHLNCISEGMQKAVEARLKSERFKTELITNVSHDIKTPLTSIINYVDLLKKQGLTGEAEEYVNILERQSARLKKLIEDLMEASKASTGNIKAEMQPMQVDLLLSQAIGEYEERFEQCGLEVITCIQPEKAEIMADGRLLWRVLDNLFNNICKYAQEKTRVYIDCYTKEETVYIVLRNISRYQLNIPEEELMERFVRGDSSRHTEGSGLGLSIARSLTQLQNGTLQILIDGDLFKATLEFPKLC